MLKRVSAIPIYPSARCWASSPVTWKLSWLKEPLPRRTPGGCATSSASRAELWWTSGRPITYHYSDQRRLAYIEDFIGRRVTFTYDDSGDLVAVTSPAVTGTPNGNDFPQGKTTRYAYSNGSTDPVLNHNLIVITAPNEVASGGPPRIQVEYDAQDRVVGYTIGGTNATGVPAGGTITYTYRTLTASAGAHLNQPVAETEVVDRNGNRTVYQFNSLGNIVTVRTTN